MSETFQIKRASYNLRTHAMTQIRSRYKFPLLFCRKSLANCTNGIKYLKSTGDFISKIENWTLNDCQCIHAKPISTAFLYDGGSFMLTSYHFNEFF